jgi:thiol-disulfide isomerase/thioredoxin
MVRLTLAFSFCLAFVVAQASDSVKVKFASGPWEVVLSEARKSNRPIFVDFYTTWCGPCIKMDKQAFPNVRVSQLFNANFVNYKVNAEKGEGVNLAKSYGVTAYPTLIFVSPTGEVVYRTEGYESVEHLLAEANKVIEVSASLNRLSTSSQSHQENLRDKAYLKEYLQKLSKLRQPASSLLEEYVNNLRSDEQTDLENLAIMAGTVSTTNSKAFDILLEQLPAIRSLPVGREALISMPAAVASDFRKVVDADDERALEALTVKHKKLLQQAGRLAPELVDQELLRQRIDFYRQAGNYKKYHALSSFYVQTQLLSQSEDSLRQQDEHIYQEFLRRVQVPDSARTTARFADLSEAMKHRASAGVADGLNAVARAHFESITDLHYLSEALQWAGRAVELSPGPTYRETYACLLYRLGRKEEAILIQIQTVAEAKEMPDLRISPEAFQQVLEKMQKGVL